MSTTASNPDAGDGVRMPVNYRRGLQRVYIVVSALWAVAIIVAVFEGWHPEAMVNGGWYIFGQPPTEVLRWNWRIVTAMCLLPPIIGYILLFHVGRWIYRGFSAKK